MVTGNKGWACIGAALFTAAFTMVVGCTAPSVGLEPTYQGSSNESDDDSESTSSKTSKQTAEDDSTVSTTKSASTVDAGSDAAKVVRCTESGAVQFNGHCYFALTSAMTFDDAKTQCAAAGAHLATLTTSAEASAASAIDTGDERWIGLSRPAGSAAKDASYVWVTGEPRNGFDIWDTAKSEPDGSCPTCGNTGDTANCGRILTNGMWADDDCAVKHASLCERE